jgi:hypothetical protein
MTKPDSKFLFVFGFEDPIEFETNKKSGSDFESSRALWIIADDPSKAENWGRSIADRFVRTLFEAENSEGYSWSDAEFAHWIEPQPTGEWTAEQLEALPVVRAGEFPDFDALDAPCAPAQTNSEQAGGGQAATRSEST